MDARVTHPHGDTRSGSRSRCVRRREAASTESGIEAASAARRFAPDGWWALTRSATRAPDTRTRAGYDLKSEDAYASAWSGKWSPPCRGAVVKPHPGCICQRDRRSLAATRDAARCSSMGTVQLFLVWCKDSNKLTDERCVERRKRCRRACDSGAATVFLVRRSCRVFCLAEQRAGHGLEPRDPRCSR